MPHHPVDSERRDIQYNLDGMQVHRISIPCYDEFTYADAVRWIWGKYNLLILEHDVFPALEQVRELLHCGHSICAFAYKLYPASTGLKEEVWAHRYTTKNGGCRWVQSNREWCDRPALGMLYVDRSIQRQVRRPSLVPWDELESEISPRICSVKPCHLHWPDVKHDHLNKYRPALIAKRQLRKS